MNNTIALVSIGCIVDHSERKRKGQEIANSQAAKSNLPPAQGSPDYAALFYTQEAFWNPDFISLDSPLPNVGIALARLDQLYETVGILTCRPDFLREATETWFRTHGLWADQCEISYAISETEERMDIVKLAAALHDQVLFVEPNGEIRAAVCALGLSNVIVKASLDDYIDDGSPIIV